MILYFFSRHRIKIWLKTSVFKLENEIEILGQNFICVSVWYVRRTKVYIWTCIHPLLTIVHSAVWYWIFRQKPTINFINQSMQSYVFMCSTHIWSESSDPLLPSPFLLEAILALSSLPPCPSSTSSRRSISVSCMSWMLNCGSRRSTISSNNCVKCRKTEIDKYNKLVPKKWLLFVISNLKF